MVATRFNFKPLVRNLVSLISYYIGLTLKYILTI